MLKEIRMLYRKKSLAWLALSLNLAALVPESAEGQQRADTLSTKQAMEMAPQELARTAFAGLAAGVKEVWRPSGLATSIGLSRLAFAASSFPSGYAGICAVDRWEVEFQPVPSAQPRLPSMIADAPARGSRLHVTRMYKVVSSVSGAYALNEEHRAMLLSCSEAGSARTFFDVQGEEDMLMEGLAGVSAAIEDRKAHLGKSADWFCFVTGEVEAKPCPSADRMHILNLGSISRIQIEHCQAYSQQYCIEATFSPNGNDNGIGASLKMAGVTFTRPDPGFMGVKVNASFSSAKFAHRAVVYD